LVFKPYYTYQFKNLGDVITALREDTGETITVEHIPQVELGKDWLIIVSGKSNIGKTSYVMNLVDDLTNQDIPTLVMPFERGIESVGKRFLQVKFDLPMDGFKGLPESQWVDIIEKCAETPVYFAMPTKNEIIETIEKSKRLFDTRVVVIDHLDYIIRHVNGNKESEIGDTLQELKRVAEDNQIVMIIVTHIRKIEQAGSALKRKPNIEDLKGSSSLYQDPECVIMLSSEYNDTIDVDVVKNKGPMENEVFNFDRDSGKLKKRLEQIIGDNDNW
jgi:replicative DNA helicase